MVDLLVSPVAAGLFGLVSLVIGKKIDNNFKLAAEERRSAKTHREAIDRRHAELFEAFVKEQAKAAIAFEGIKNSVVRIGKELGEMRVETREHRIEITRRIHELECASIRHSAQIEQLQQHAQGGDADSFRPVN